MSFANVFSQFVAYLFILLMLSFAEHKFVILMKSSVSIISFMDGAFSAVSKKSFLYWKSSMFSSMLSCRRFIVLNFTLWSMIYIELIFVKVWVLCLDFFVSVKKKSLLKRLSFPHCIAFVAFIEDQLSLFMRVCLGASLFWSIDLFVYSFTKTTLS